MAQELRQLGIQPGDRVLAQIEKSPAAIALYLATLRAGAVWVPLNSQYTDAELEHFLRDAEPALVVCDIGRVQSLTTLVSSSRLAIPIRIAALSAEGFGDLQIDKTISVTRTGNTNDQIAARSSHDLAAIVYTSGTTGKPKGAMLTHGNLLSNAHALISLWEFSASDVLLHALPIFHVHGLFVATHCALLAGSKIILYNDFDLELIARDLPQATVFMGVPTYYSRLLAYKGFTRTIAEHMRLFVSGSAPLTPQLFAEFEQRTGHRILERYGMSEAGMITSNPYRGERVAGSVGYALPNVEVRVVNNDGSLAPPGIAGSLEIRGPNVCAGYWRKEDRNADFRKDGFFVTGDVAEMAADGRITLVGRAKDLIISGGLNVYPKEIELALDSIAGVAESCVFGAPHPDFGEAVIAAVRCQPGAAISAEQIMEFLRPRLARFKQPKKLLFVDELPRNAMGKVQKQRLRELHRNSFTCVT
jgi:malonyl-CoA/methylmalonyl-CoA synthetase